MLKKQTAHNLNEVKALIKESFSRGDEEAYQGTEWIAHTGERLCRSKIRLTEFELELPDMSSLTMEVV